MSDRFFLDTNVLVYSFDRREPAKQKLARSLIDKALSSHSGIISWQVAQEFLHAAQRKFEKPFSVSEAKAYLDLVLGPLCEVFPTVALYRRALELREETGFGYYDSLIVASAVEGGCRTIFTENLQSGRKVAGALLQNPFA